MFSNILILTTKLQSTFLQKSSNIPSKFYGDKLIIIYRTFANLKMLRVFFEDENSLKYKKVPGYFFSVNLWDSALPVRESGR